MSRLDTLLEIIRERRSVKWLEPGPIPLDKIKTALEAAIWAPNAHNRQPWRFVVVVDESVRRELLYRMAERWREDLRRDGLDEETIENVVGGGLKRSMRASILIIACITMRDMDKYPDERRQGYEHIMATQSLAAALQNMLLTLHALGLAACWRCSPLFAQEEVREVLGLPDDVEPQAMIEVGVGGVARNPSRKPLSEVAYLDRWGEPLR